MPWPIPVLRPLPEPEPPKWTTWLLLFVVIMLAGAGLVLTLWPQSKTTQSVDFWLLIVGAPALVFAATFGIRLAAYERARSRKEAWDRQIALLTRDWHAWCRRRQWVSRVNVFLAAGGHADHWLNDRKRLPVNLDRAVPLGLPFADTPQKWLTHLLGVVVERVAKDIAATQGTLNVRILLDATTEAALRDGGFDASSEMQRLLEQIAVAKPLDAQMHAGAGFERLGDWIDQQWHAPLLLIAAQRIDRAESSVFSEGAVALWLRPTQADNAAMPADACLFRPMVSDVASLHGDFTKFQEMQCQPGAQADIWHSGLDGYAQGVVLAAASALRGGHAAQACEVHEHKLDEVAGRAGPISGWIALGLAAQAAVNRQRPQIVVSAGGAGSIVIGTVSAGIAGQSELV